MRIERAINTVWSVPFIDDEVITKLWNALSSKERIEFIVIGNVDTSLISQIMKC